MAVGASFCISLFFKTLIFVAKPEINGFRDSLGKAWESFTTNSYPWLTMAFVTAIVTAFLIDWKFPRRLTGAWRPVFEGIFEAVLLVVAAWLVHWWLSGLSMNNRFFGKVPELATVIRISGGVGFVLGYFVPKWYRLSRPASGRTAAGRER